MYLVKSRIAKVRGTGGMLGKLSRAEVGPWHGAGQLKERIGDCRVEEREPAWSGVVWSRRRLKGRQGAVQAN
ncbi:hypothetical protein ACLOJK_012443 [Asimina triloba]